MTNKCDYKCDYKISMRWETRACLLSCLLVMKHFPMSKGRHDFRFTEKNFSLDKSDQCQTYANVVYYVVSHFNKVPQLRDESIFPVACHDNVKMWALISVGKIMWENMRVKATSVEATLKSAVTKLIFQKIWRSVHNLTTKLVYRGLCEIPSYSICWYHFSDDTPTPAG